MFRRALVAVFFAALAPALAAQDFAHQLTTDYQGKLLLLRGFYQDNFLHYDSSGATITSGHTGSWTTSFVYIKDVYLRSKSLEIKGARMAQQFDRADRKFHPTATNVAVELEIEVADPPSEPQVRSALARVFIGPHDPLPELVPESWRWVLQHIGPDHTLETAPASPQPLGVCTPDSSVANPCCVSNGVKPPRIIRADDPAYDPFAKKANYQATTVLWVVVDEHGRVQNPIITRPCGFGLDDLAVEAVRKWTFRPGTLNGHPVPVQMNIEVNFRLY